MFVPTSRYYKLPTTKFTTLDGRTVAYVRRRLLPQASSFHILGEVIVEQGDRLEQITARTLGVPEQFWQICDASNTMNPADLTKELGQRLRIPMPQV